jgi:NitT/TauT family transport system permease protein
VTVTSTRTARPRWSALPQRRPPRPRPAVATLRVPIPRRARLLLVIVSISGPFVAWWLLATTIADPKILPSPLAAIEAAVEMAKSGQLLTDVWASVQRVLYGFGLAVAISVPLGLVMGSFRSGLALFEPVLGVLRYLPAAAFIPMLIAWQGLEEAPKITLIFLATFFFNTLMIADVVRGVPANLIDVSYTLGARTGEIIRKVIAPHSLPGIIDAIRVNAAAGWGFVVVAELYASESGLGYRINRAARFRNFDDMFAALIVIGLIGVAIDVALRLLRDRVGRWA